MKALRAHKEILHVVITSQPAGMRCSCPLAECTAAAGPWGALYVHVGRSGGTSTERTRLDHLVHFSGGLKQNSDKVCTDVRFRAANLLYCLLAGQKFLQSGRAGFPIADIFTLQPL